MVEQTFVPDTPLLRNKLVPPRPGSGCLERADLVRRLRAGATPGRFTYVGAPAGTGKTTMLAQFARAGPVGWYSADAMDDTVTSFWAYVLAALGDAAEHAAQRACRVLAAPGTSLTEDMLPALVNDLTALPHPLTLVVDDFDLIADPRIHETLGFLVEHLPPTLSLVVSSRHQPPARWPTSRLRGRNLLLELGEEDLRLTRADAARLLAGELGAPLPAADADRLYESTEGWCAGLHLAALSLRGRPDVHRLAATFSGTDRNIAGYLMSEVLARQPERMRAFLRRTSILDRCGVELCDEVTGGDDAARLLRRAECDQLFLVSLDNRGRWFRYQRMMRDVLRQQLHRDEPDVVPELHRRAGRWLQRNGMLADAVRHAMAAGDAAGAHDLVRRDYFRLANDGRVNTAISWFDTLGAATLQADPRLAVARAMTGVLSGDLEGALAFVQEAAARAGADPAVRADIEAKTALIQQMHGYANGDVARAREWSAAALSRVPRDDVWFGTVLAHTAFVDMRRGEDDPAVHALRRCLARADATGHHILAVRAMGGLALVYCATGERDAAREWIDRAARDPRWRRLDEHTLTWARHFAAGWLALTDDRPAAAEPALTRACELVRRGPYRIEQAEVGLTLAAARSRLGRSADAAALRSEARRILSGCADHGRLIVPPGHEPLTEREAAVLAVLAEGLTNAQMARRLHVSERTVAAHLRAIYRKLGVGSRSAATRYALDNHLVPA